MDEKHERFSVPPIGASSLLAAFAVLCLVVFALLALSTVRADRRLSDASLQATKDYYAADCKAQEILARLRNGEKIEDVEVELAVVDYPDRSETRYTYTVPISETQELQVSVVLGDREYEILRWQATPVGAWSEDDTLHLWDSKNT